MSTLRDGGRGHRDQKPWWLRRKEAEIGRRTMAQGYRVLPPAMREFGRGPDSSLVEPDKSAEAETRETPIGSPREPAPVGERNKSVTSSPPKENEHCNPSMESNESAGGDMSFTNTREPALVDERNMIDTFSPEDSDHHSSLVESDQNVEAESVGISFPHIGEPALMDERKKVYAPSPESKQKTGHITLERTSLPQFPLKENAISSRNEENLDFTRDNLPDENQVSSQPRIQESTCFSPRKGDFESSSDLISKEHAISAQVDPETDNSRSMASDSKENHNSAIVRPNETAIPNSCEIESLGFKEDHVSEVPRSLETVIAELQPQSQWSKTEIETGQGSLSKEDHIPDRLDTEDRHVSAESQRDQMSVRKAIHAQATEPTEGVSSVTPIPIPSIPPVKNYDPSAESQGEQVSVPSAEYLPSAREKFSFVRRQRRAMKLRRALDRALRIGENVRRVTGPVSPVQLDQVLIALCSSSEEDQMSVRKAIHVPAKVRKVNTEPTEGVSYVQPIPIPSIPPVKNHAPSAESQGEQISVPSVEHLPSSKEKLSVRRRALRRVLRIGKNVRKVTGSVQLSVPRAEHLPSAKEKLSLRRARRCYRALRRAGKVRRALRTALRVGEEGRRALRIGRKEESGPPVQLHQILPSFYSPAKTHEPSAESQPKCRKFRTPELRRRGYFSLFHDTRGTEPAAREPVFSPVDYHSEESYFLYEQLVDLGLMRESEYEQTAPLHRKLLAVSFRAPAENRRFSEFRGSENSGKPSLSDQAPLSDQASLSHEEALRKSVQQDEERWEAQWQELYFGDLEKLKLAEHGIENNIHILGTGNIGQFIAHSLAGTPNPPKITLLLHRPLRIQEWYDEGQAITLYVGGEAITRTGFHVESSSSFAFDPNASYPAFGPNLETSVVPPVSVIDHLIVTTKVTQTVSALQSVKSRLRPTSTICFLHNGSGIIEQVNREIFPHSITRPNYVVGILTHGVGSVDGRKFSCTYNGKGEISLCSLDRHLSPLAKSTAIKRDHYGYSPTVRFLARSLTRCAELQASGYTYYDFIFRKLEKLAVNAVINPLSVIYDCTNKDLLENLSIKKTMRSLLEEISAVFLALPELNNEDMPAKISRQTLEHKFSANKLSSQVYGVAEKTGANYSSMLQDVRKGKATEIAYINGWISQQGQELGIPTPINDFLVNTVKGRLVNVKKSMDGYVPFIPPDKTGASKSEPSPAGMKIDALDNERSPL